MSFKPLIINQGLPQQLPVGQAIDVGGWILPTAGGTINYVLMADGSGNAIWAQVDHGNTTGRSDDDHTLYLLADGSRVLAGNWSLGGYNLTSVGLFGGVDLPTMNMFFNGTFQETFDAVVTSDGATITMSLEQAGTGDLTMQFSDGYTTLDCTDPLQTIVLTAGADDTSPQANYIYILQSDKILTKSTSSWPAGEHIRVAYFLVPSATFVAANGCYVNQNCNDHLMGTDLQGHMSHMTAKLRRLGATWYSGVNANGATASYFTIGVNTVDWLSTSGEIDQLHEHTFPAVETSGSDIVLVVNQFGTAYDDITDLYSITDDNTGDTIDNNRYFNLVFWGVVNKSGEFAALMVNLPGGFYVQQGDALIDSDGHDVYDIPREFSIDSGTAFLICRVTFKMGSTWTHVSTVDLRGLTPATASGSSVNDHGGLGGLLDDNDHTNLHTDGRAATWLAANHETTYNHVNYDTAYGWGDHASGGYLKADGSLALTAHWAAGAYNITGLALLTVDNITIDAATIISDTGAISFVNENLTTTGWMVAKNLPRPSGDNEVLVSTAVDTAAWSGASADQFLASDEDGEVAWTDKTKGDTSYWIATGGNDSTGAGTEGNPWLTIGKCITTIQANSWAPDDVVTIYLETGEYTGWSLLTIPKIVPELRIYGRTPWSFSMTDTVSQASVAGNVYDVRITLNTTTNLSAGMFVLIEQCSALPEINGCWEIRTVHDSTDITIRLTWARQVPHIGAYAATLYVPKAHIYKSSAGALFDVYTSKVTFYGLMLEGTSGWSIKVAPIVEIILNAHVGVSGWADGAIYISDIGTVKVTSCAFSDCGTGIQALAGGNIHVTGSAISGMTYAMTMFSDAYMEVRTSYFASCNYTMLAARASMGFVTTSTIINNTQIAFWADKGSTIIASGSCTLTFNVSDYSPALDVQGNANSWITS